MSEAMSNPDPRLVRAYGKTKEATLTPRSGERDVLALVTRRLRAALADPSDTMLFTRSISDNMTLWSVLVSDVMMPENALPEELKGQIASVGLAVIRECRKVSSATEKVNVQALITINESIIDGLSS